MNLLWVIDDKGNKHSLLHHGHPKKPKASKPKKPKLVPKGGSKPKRILKDASGQHRMVWDEKKHPRGGKGSKAGGKFVKKGTASPPMPYGYHPDNTKFQFREEVTNPADPNEEDSLFRGSSMWDTWFYDHQDDLKSPKAKKAYKTALEKWRKLPTKETKTEWNKQWWAKTNLSKLERSDPRLYALGHGETEEEHAMVNYWTGNGYQSIREAADYLEDGVEVTENSVRDLKLFESALEKQMPYKGTVWRGMKLSDGALSKWLDAVGKEKVARLRMPSSATRLHTKAYNFADPKPHTVILRIRQQSGAWIEHNSQYKTEKEVVLKRGTKYKIVRHEEVPFEKVRSNVREYLHNDAESVHYFTMIEVHPKHKETHNLSIY